MIFTGLIQSLGTVAREKSSDDGIRLTVSSALADELQQGDSIAVNGVCLTANEVDGDPSPVRVAGKPFAGGTLFVPSPAAVRIFPDGRIRRTRLLLKSLSPHFA